MSVNPAIPLNPPREWFTPPATMPKDAGCIVESDGRIYGYLCHWGAVLMDGSKDRWTAPKSKTDYSYAHTGDTLCDDGDIVKTANLGSDAGHAPGSDFEDPERLGKLQDFYENTQTQLARVRYGEDKNGVWFAGACWPTVTDLDIAKLRASARSGHWAAIGDWRDLHSGRVGYELVGACLVNVPGLKYARADKAASGVISLRPLNESSDPVSLLADKGYKTERIASSGTFELESHAGVAVSGVLVVEDAKTEDGRILQAGSVEWRETPLPLYAKLENTPGHDDAILVGRIDEIWRDEADNKVVRYSATIMPASGDEYGQRVMQAIGDQMLKGVSIDGIACPEDSYADDDETWVFTRIVIAGATLTPMPAIDDATVTIGENAEGEFATMATDTAAADETTDVDAEVEETQSEDTAAEDQTQALSEKVQSLSDRIEYLISLIEASELNARYEAATQRLSAKVDQ